MEELASPESTKPKRRWPGAILLSIAATATLAGIAGLAGGLYLAGWFSGERPPLVSADENQARAAGWIKAKHAGSFHLNVPSQAEYPWESVSIQPATTADGGAMWEVTGVVDAPDELGNKQRTPWEAAIIKVGNEFKAAYVKFGDQVIWRN
jgi:hypothetical protein